MNHVFGFARCSLGEHLAPGCTQAHRDNVMLWGMFCWQTLGPTVHVDGALAHNTYLSLVADHVFSLHRDSITTSKPLFAIVHIVVFEIF